MQINILIHGYSEGYTSEFMQYIAKNLEKNGKEVLGFDFRYITNHSEPSENLEDELNQLKDVIEDCKKNGYTHINLIGKSLGGTIALNPKIIQDEYISDVVLLGFPLALGYPADLSILKNKLVYFEGRCIDTYKELFENIGDTVSKITIIQGREDWLGEKDILLSFFKEVSHKPDVKFVNNASHGFKPIKEGKTLEENLNEITAIILSKIV